MTFPHGPVSIPAIRSALSSLSPVISSCSSSQIHVHIMQPNQWQQGYSYNGGFQPQQASFQPGNPGAGATFMSSQPTGFQQPMQTGFNQSLPQQQQQRPGFNFSSGPTGIGGNFGLLNQPSQSQASFRSSGLNAQPTGYPGGGASGLMSQQTGFQGGMLSQPTGFGGLQSQPTGFAGLRAQPTGVQDPRLQSMMQSFMPSNLSQVISQQGYSIHTAD